MRILASLLLIAASLVFSLPTIAFAQGEAKLLKIVALSRHGVRSPTQDAKTLSMWSQKTWPVWPVKKGELTPRGGRLVTAMWKNLDITFKAKGLLQQASCPAPGSVFIRADVDERTKATADAIAMAMGDNCSIGYAVMDEKVDPLFHPVKAGLYRFNPIPAATDVLSMTSGGLENLQEDFSGALALLGRINGPPASAMCARFTLMPNCQIADLPNAISVSPDGTNIRLVGSLGVASSLAEIFLLEYGEWPGVSAGWGQVDATTLSQLLPVHSTIFDVVNRAPVVAWAKGSSLLNEMTAALFNEHYDPRCNDAKLVIFVGHDTNIANVGGLMGMTWQVAGYPRNGIPPAGVIFFELWEQQGKKYVEAKFLAQPLKALHSAFEDNNWEVFAPREATVSVPPVVGEARYDMDAFRSKVNIATGGAPIAPKQTPPLRFNKVVPNYN